ncbi:aminotransferase class V-fold PLP-dependent enzyme [Catalinimonas niigatensis]|uniref:aminotransferase class V-fold PLP-dependent enzyme n=1 Tax=Catalinimonas niigatensis TaxID=1397264 RepID=UPI0026666EFA|nr:aminotransferase class V-fold PLP-dependent enzyme [Catalinimonas niigatensis]WPP51240.1 aminotransferase class V-fold PLP-dependent enzyme [Catalinimonas niigatensis]
MNRREIIKQLSVLPFVGGALGHESMLNTAAQGSILSSNGPLKADQNIYNAIGVETIINCRGTFTIIGGSIERPEVLEAMEAASGYFVQYDELAYGIGKRLAELTKSDWGMVSSGCAAAMKHVTAACVTGGNPEKLVRIPDLTGFEKTEVIIPRYSRNVYDHAVRNIGVTIVEVETAEELEKAINSKTAMIYIMTGGGSESGQPLSLEVIASIAKPKNIPILADAAAEDLTIPCVHLEQGATVVAYSGGKAICGPQCAGLLLGDKDLLMSAWQASSPHHGPGRDNKVGKEEMLGMLAAVEAWTTRDHKAEWKTWLSWLDEISQKVTKIKGVTTNVTEPKGLSNHAPVLHISWDPGQLHIMGDELAEELARNKPRVAIGSRNRDGMTSVNVTPNQMKEENVKVVADRIYGVLSQKRSPRKTELAPAKVDVSGHWEVEVKYFTSTSLHALFIQQDGNWIEGTHKADFSMQDVVGMVEDDVVKLSSRQRSSGDSISFLFSGKVVNDTMKGSIYLGEYLTAEFTAKRAKYDHERRPVVIPGGPPLAT